MRKKLRRLCMNPQCDVDPKMHTLYECVGKIGTHSTTVIWFLENPQKGMTVYGIENVGNLSPYMNGHAFRYARFTPFVIEDVYDDGYVICNRLGA